MARLTRRGLIAAFAAAGLAAPAFARPLQPPAPPLEQDLTTSLDAWIDAYGRPTAKVMINGRGPFQFMVDTGSTTTVIAERHLHALGLEPGGAATLAGTTGLAQTPLAVVDEISSGAVSRRRLRLAVLPDVNLAKVDGILGADVFAAMRLEFRIPERVVRIAPSVLRRKTPVEANMRVRNGLLAEIDGEVGSVRARLMLDTGAQTSIGNLPLSEALRRAHPHLGRVDNVGITGVTGQTIIGEYIALPPVNLRAFGVRDSGCVAAEAPIFGFWGLDSEPAMIVGVDILSRLDSFSIDYGAREFQAVLTSDLTARNGLSLG